MSDEGFTELGWVKFGRDPYVMDWIDAVRPAAITASDDPDLRRQWLRSGGTWFVGVNALGNDAAGRIGGGQPLPGTALADARRLCPHFEALDRGQVSVAYPGYPQQDPQETDAAFRFRRDRAAAHLDGLHRGVAGSGRRFREHHAFILGIPLGCVTTGSSPVVVWEGSHHIMRVFLQAELGDLPPEKWATRDLSDAYAAARREVFATCPQREITTNIGEAYILHRFAVHGVMPWGNGTTPRAVIYFRPEAAGLTGFLQAP